MRSCLPFVLSCACADPPSHPDTVLFPSLRQTAWFAGAAAVVPYTPCGPDEDAAWGAPDLTALTWDPATGTVWGIGAGFVRRDPGGRELVPLAPPPADAHPESLAWDPVRERVVGIVTSGVGGARFVAYHPAADRWTELGELQGSFEGDLAYDPVHDGFLVRARRRGAVWRSTVTELVRLDAELQVVATLPGRLDVRGHLQLATSADAVWGLGTFGGMGHIGTELVGIDVETGRGEVEPCGTWKARGRPLGAVTGTVRPGAGTVLQVVDGVVREADACGEGADVLALGGDVVQATRDPATGDVYTVGGGLLTRWPVDAAPQPLPLPEGLDGIDEVHGVAWAEVDGRAYVLGGGDPVTGAGETALLSWSTADGWRVEASLGGLDQRWLAWDPERDRLYSQNWHGDFVVELNRSGAMLRRFDEPKGVPLAEEVVLHALDGEVLLVSESGERWVMETERGGFERVACR